MKIETCVATVNMLEDSNGEMVEVLLNVPIHQTKEIRLECRLSITSSGSIYCTTDDDSKSQKYHIVANKRGQLRIKKCGKKYV